MSGDFVEDAQLALANIGLYGTGTQDADIREEFAVEMFELW